MSTETTAEDPRLDRAADWLYRYARVTNRAFMPYVRRDAEVMLAVIDGPDPTWRDVIRAMRAEDVRLRPLGDTSDVPDNRSWQLVDRHGNELGQIAHETGYWGEEWTVSFAYELGPSTRLGAPALEPADVLDLARISGLIGGGDRG